MSVGRQFRRIGETGVAFGLWAIVIWLFPKPKLLLVLLVIFFIFIFSIVSLLDDTGDTFYVNSNSLELLDKPFGTAKMTLEMNDSLILISKMSGDWMQVSVGIDTLYFKDNFYNDKELAYTYKIQKTPFSKWKALQETDVVLNHPDGYLEAGGTMMKNGDLMRVLSYSERDNTIRFKNGGGSFTAISVDYLTINWRLILKKYPKIQ